MIDLNALTNFCGVMVFAAPAVLVAVFGISSMLDRKLSENAAARAVYITTVISLLACLAVLSFMLRTESRHVVIGPWNWVSVGSHGGGSEVDHAREYHFVVKFVFDRLSIPFVILSLIFCGTIGAFSSRYMHREPGYNRFFVLYSLFLLGMVTAGAAGTIETLFTGWELVGLSSALLVGFFHERRATVQNGLRIWVIYRLSDAALLLAAILLHHLSVGGDFDSLTGYRETPGVDMNQDAASWPHGVCNIDSIYTLAVGLLLLCSAAGKSALLPFSGWLPRAMEGPTPSSAVFYGALSVHLGAYLLLRVSPLFDQSPVLSIITTILGLSTAAFAALAARAQTDIKSALSFSSLTQVGLIVAEIGIGWRYIPLIHLLGHASLRTLQFVRAPTFLQDRRNLENTLGGNLYQSNVESTDRMRWLRRFAIERGYLDALLDRYIVSPFLRVFRTLDRAELKFVKSMEEPRSNPTPPMSDKVAASSSPSSELVQQKA